MPDRERFETVFTVEATPITYGPGASDEAGWELRRLGVTRAMLLSDPGVVRAGITERIAAQITAAGIACTVFDRVRVEPTLTSMQEAADFAIAGGFDGFVGVGGGSSLDTAKVAALLATYPAPILDYVNLPIGGGRVPPGPLKPLLAIPTTAGTGSEATSVAVLDIPEQGIVPVEQWARIVAATSVAVLDIPEQGVKTGISHRLLRPARGLVDPLLTRGLPSAVTASAGLDVICHAAESYTTRPYTARSAPATPADRPPYQGANPVADIWAAQALEYGGTYLRRAVAARDGDDIEARGAMMLGASLAGIGFGSAGVHIPHACAYPIASLKHVYQPLGYPNDHPFVPHGFSVIVTAPAAFRFTFSADPMRHRRVAELLAGTPLPNADADTLPAVLVQLMRDIGAPSGLRALGYDANDIPALVAGALKQQRLLVGSPCPVDAGDLAAIFRASMTNW